MLEESDFFEDSSSLETVTEDSLDSSNREGNSSNFSGSFDKTSCESGRVCEDLGRTLSIESIASRRKKRSSLILNWLADPENKIMYQGRHIDSKIFRSHSAVESRTCSNFTKSTRYHSFRHEGKTSICESKTSIAQQNGWICELEITRDVLTNHTCAKIPVVTNDIIESGVPCALQQIHSEDQGGKMDSSQQKVTESQFSSRIADTKIEKDYSSFDFRELNSICNKLEDERSAVIDAKKHRKARSFNSLPNYGRSQQVKLRRMNSDALFYTGGRRNCDKRKNFEFHSRNRLTIQGRGRLEKECLLKKADVGMCSCKDGIALGAKVNSQEFINSIEKIFVHGDLEVIRGLAECGFDFNTKDNSGNCALHYAAQRGSEKIITEILENGGNVWVRNNDNQLPVELASNMNVRMLLSGVTLFYRGQYSNEIESRLTSKQMSFEL